MPRFEQRLRTAGETVTFQSIDLFSLPSHILNLTYNFFQSSRSSLHLSFPIILLFSFRARSTQHQRPHRALSHLSNLFLPDPFLFFNRRCWDLSAGNLKWIYQVPILVAVVVSTPPTHPHPRCFEKYKYFTTPAPLLKMRNYAFISLFRLILCYF